MVKDILASHLSVTETFFNEVAAELDAFADDVVACMNSGNKVMLCGNGGSAADAQHIAAEFVGRFVKDRPSLPSIALTTDTSALTAIGNDYGYDEVFSRQVAGLGQKGDILIGISTSGNSKNVIRAFEVAQEKGIMCVLLAGRDGGAAVKYADKAFVVRHNVTAQIQECHIMFLHTMCSLMEAKMGID
ncbi:MAG: SIS domain-containing protein [Proteobacteria bacterium]|nr:SIS domain-containing protein [Pseudomonadota bacterium]